MHRIGDVRAKPNQHDQGDEGCTHDEETTGIVERSHQRFQSIGAQRLRGAGF